jgi:hypothetical protein
VVTVANGTPELHLWVLPEVDRTHLLPDEILPPTFAYIFEGTRKLIPTNTIVKRPVSTHGIAAPTREHVRAPLTFPGDTAAPLGANFVGTAGWYIVLNNVPVCLSNWHVLCAQGNNTSLNSRILLANQNIASLYLFRPINFGGSTTLGPNYNTWDYALAQFDNIQDAGGSMRPCDNGSIYPYPQALGSTFDFGDTFYKVGARPPICREGKLTSVGTLWVNYDNLGNVGAWFSNQLMFDKMTDHGDSGAVIVSKRDNKVVALNFAGDIDTTVGNPIYQLDWDPTGSRKLLNGQELPMFSTRSC